MPYFVLKQQKFYNINVLENFFLDPTYNLIGELKLTNQYKHTSQAMKFIE